MSEHLDLEFTYMGHCVQVSHRSVPGAWNGGPATEVTAIIDGVKTGIPGIWRAYKTAGEKGAALLIKTYLDAQAAPSR